MNNFKIMVDEMKVRGYSRKTIKNYTYMNNKFLNFIDKSPKDVTKKDIESYLVYLYDRNKSSATRHLICSALKFYYEIVLKRRFHLRYPKKEKKLPIVLSKEEILKMIGCLKNTKHRLLIKLMYGSGLRLGEVIKARIEDFDIKRKIIVVKQGKGKKDRIVNLSNSFVSEFLQYTKGKDEGFLFEPAGKPGKYIKDRAVQNIIKRALRKAEIRKKAHCHTLRTSYATHLIEEGIDVSYVQKLLGHSSLKTTQAYLRLSSESLSKIKSPLD